MSEAIGLARKGKTVSSLDEVFHFLSLVVISLRCVDCLRKNVPADELRSLKDMWLWRVVLKLSPSFQAVVAGEG